MTWSRYVAIGDSFTEGMSDPSPDQPDTYVGWADRLAAHLASKAADEGRDFGYANLAIRGRLLADVEGPQLDAALELQPDLVSIVGGPNDLLRPGTDIDDLADRLEAAVAKIRATGADVLMSTTADPGFAPLLRRIRPRTSVFTANIWGIAQRQGAYVLDMWNLRVLRDPRLWATDRLHLTTEGHQRVAAQAAWALGDRDTERDWAIPLPPAPPLSRIAAVRGHAEWAQEYLGPWVHRRLTGRSSGDNVTPKRPNLTPIDTPTTPGDTA